MKEPVLLLVFNRPDLVARVFPRIREVQPARLFVAADGPCPNHPEDSELCERLRDIATKADWDCELYTLFRDQNLGCKEAVGSAITWFFDHVEHGIILENTLEPARPRVDRDRCESAPRNRPSTQRDRPFVKL